MVFMDNNTIIGYAVCDLDKTREDIRRIKTSLPGRAIEIQREGKIWTLPMLIDATENYEFISVHAPTRNTDISSRDDMKLEYSRNKTIESMDIAHGIGADILVLHPVHYEGWLEPNDRNKKRNIFLDTYEHVIVPYYLDNFHDYHIAIENIEYSKYPATLEETEELHKAMNSIHPVGMVIDIPHIWNSRRILSENPHLEDMIYGYPRTPEVLYEYVEKFIKHNHDNILMYHIANYGTNPIRTHDPITEDTVHPDLKRLVGIIRDKPIILEIYKHDYKTLRESKKTIEELT